MHYSKAVREGKCREIGEAGLKKTIMFQENIWSRRVSDNFQNLCRENEESVK